MALKFKAGDKVRVVKGWDTLNGYTGVVAIASEAGWFPYNVTLDEIPVSMSNTVFRENWMMEEDELELVED